MNICILDSITKIVKNVCVLDSPEDAILLEGEELALRHDGGVGWKWNDDDWEIPQPEITYDEKCIIVRQQRSLALKRIVDRYTPVRWSSLTTEQQQQVLDYRQALLDITQQDGFPDNIIWPEVPKFDGSIKYGRCGI